MNINIAIIGTGPNGLYILNSILNFILFRNLYNYFNIYLFDKINNFGTGWAHSPFQSSSSMLNRISGQLSYSPDFYIRNNINFQKWCINKFNFTKDIKYNKSSDEFPTRQLYGESLKEIFNNIFQEILYLNNYIYLINIIVKKIKKNLLGDYFLICNKYISLKNFNFVIVTTGHQEKKYNFYLSKTLCSIIQYFNFSYPLFNINNWMKKKILIIGMGLTSIDLILFYTENKSGKFLRMYQKLFYRNSFFEPRYLYTISRSGYFTYSRPHNFKEINLNKYEHIGFFLNIHLIDIIRKYFGISANIFNSFINKHYQIDFDIHVFPFIYLELKLSYYKILFGFEVVSFILFIIKYDILFIFNQQNFFYQNKKLLIDFLSKRIDSLIFNLIFKINFYIKNKIILNLNKIPYYLFYNKFLSTILGKNFKLNINYKYLIQKINLEIYLFNFGFILNPIKYINYSLLISFKDKLIKFMELDRLQSEQGNLDNPYKGACDDIFRDLRQIIVYAIDLGGINPGSYNIMINKFYSVHNRSANGNCIELMEKIESIIVSKILDIQYTKSNIQIYNNNVYINNMICLSIKKINVIIDAKLHNFCTITMKNDLFKNILFEKVGSQWIFCDFINIRNNINSFNLNKNFQLINIHDECEFIFCLGQPSEGIFFFQNGSIRPFVHHHVANDILLSFFKIQQELVIY